MVAALSLRDVDHDGALDVALFLTDDDEPESHLQHHLWLFTASPEAPWELGAMVAADARLLGVRDDRALLAAMPDIDHFEAPSAGMSPGRLVARAELATAAERRAALPPDGLHACEASGPALAELLSRCRVYPLARVDDALLARLRRGWQRFARLEADASGASGTLFELHCEPAEGAIQCSATTGSPYGMRWTVAGQGEAMRLAEITSWSVGR